MSRETGRHQDMLLPLGFRRSRLSRCGLVLLERVETHTCSFRRRGRDTGTCSFPEVCSDYRVVFDYCRVSISQEVAAPSAGGDLQESWCN